MIIYVGVYNDGTGEKPTACSYEWYQDALQAPAEAVEVPDYSKVVLTLYYRSHEVYSDGTTAIVITPVAWGKEVWNVVPEWRSKFDGRFYSELQADGLQLMLCYTEIT